VGDNVCFVGFIEGTLVGVDVGIAVVKKVGPPVGDEVMYRAAADPKLPVVIVLNSAVADAKLAVSDMCVFGIMCAVGIGVVFDLRRVDATGWGVTLCGKVAMGVGAAVGAFVRTATSNSRSASSTSLRLSALLAVETAAVSLFT
jgi:hypothetical protein